MVIYNQTKTDSPSNNLFLKLACHSIIYFIHSGMASLIKYLNSKGFKFGLVSCKYLAHMFNSTYTPMNNNRSVHLVY